MAGPYASCGLVAKSALLTLTGAGGVVCERVGRRDAAACWLKPVEALSHHAEER